MHVLVPCGAARVIAVVITIVVFANKVIVSWTCGTRTVRFMPGQYPPAPLSVPLSVRLEVTLTLIANSDRLS